MILFFVGIGRQQKKMNDFYRVEVQEADDGSVFMELPPELLEKLGWEVGDELLWEETELCYDDGEAQGLVLSRAANNQPVDG